MRNTTNVSTCAKGMYQIQYENKEALTIARLLTKYAQINDTKS